MVLIKIIITRLLIKANSIKIGNKTNIYLGVLIIKLVDVRSNKFKNMYIP